MSIGATDTDTTQVDELHGELRKLIKLNGLKKAIIRLRSLNNSKEDDRVMDTYEHIIVAVVQVYGVTEKQLYEDVGKFVATDARRSAYVLLNKHLNYTQANIAVQFGKKREAVNWSMMEFNKMIKDDFYKDSFRKRHEEVEKIVEQNINKRLPQIDNKPDKPLLNKTKKDKS